MSYMKRLSKCLFFKKPPLPEKFLGAHLSNNSALKCLSWKCYGICCFWGSASSQDWSTVYQNLFSHFSNRMVWAYKLSVSVFWAFWVLKLLKDIDGNVHFPLGDVWQTDLTLIDWLSIKALPYYRINLKFFCWPF